MIEALKFLNYCQLASNSLVSKRYRNLIRTQRQSLARLVVYEFRTFKCVGWENTLRNPSTITVFGKLLSREAYDEWIIRNEYSKQIPVAGQVVEMESTQDDRNYHLWAYAYYNRTKESRDPGSVLRARIELSNESWPVFQHFVRLLTDPFICIHNLQLTSQNDVLNLLIGAMYQDHNRLQCKSLMINDLDKSMQKFLSWTKDHVLCDKFYICDRPSLSNYDEVFLDFFMTGANCTSKVSIAYYDLSKVIINLLPKFMDLKNSDECRVVESIRGHVKKEVLELLKRDYANFIVKEKRGYYGMKYEFVISNIGKNLTCVLRLS